MESPFPEYAVPRMWTWVQRVRRHVCDDYAPRTLEEFVDNWREQPGKKWAVYRGHEIGGMISVQQVSPVVAMSHILFKQTFWGWETTVPALQAVYQQVFEGGVEKIAALVFADNHNVIGLAKRLGAQREGVLRRHTRREGQLVDMVAIGLLREEFEEACRSGHKQQWGLEAPSLAA